MKKSKKKVYSLLLSGMIFSSAFAFTACGESHVHEYSAEWSNDGNNHWHAATCEHEGETAGLEPHDYTVNVVEPTCTDEGYTEHTCQTCGYSYKDSETEASGHAFSEVWSSDSVGHWHKSTCGHTSLEQKQNHTFVFKDGIGMQCSECGRENTVPTAGLEYTELSDGTYSVTKGEITETECVIIPRTYNGKLVTEIGTLAFSGLKWLKYAVLPDSITSIGSNSFLNSGLENIVIPNSVKEIKASAFEGAGNLKRVTLPDSITSIKGRAFHSTGLEEIVIPNSIDLIEVSTFYNCANLKKVVLPSGLKNIQNEAFHKCPSLEYTEKDGGMYLGSANNPYYALIKAKDKTITECTVADGCVLIYDQAFLDCKSLEQITFPTSLKLIGGRVFVNCSKLTDYYYLGTQQQWNNVEVGTYNPSLTAATAHFQNN